LTADRFHRRDKRLAPYSTLFAVATAALGLVTKLPHSWSAAGSKTNIQLILHSSVEPTVDTSLKRVLLKPPADYSLNADRILSIGIKLDDNIDITMGATGAQQQHAIRACSQ